MKNLFSGFDSFKPDEELKEQTRERIISQKLDAVTPRRRPYKFAIAACAASLAVVLSVTFIVGNPLSLFLEPTVEGGEEADEAWRDTAMIIKDSATAGTPDDAEIGEYTEIKESKKTTTTKKEMADGAATEESSNQTISAGLLTAKYFCDNDKFPAWAALVKQGGVFSDFVLRWKLNTADRVGVYVKNGQSTVCGATVLLLDAQGKTLWSAVTDNKGRAYLFFNVTQTNEKPAKVRVSMGGVSVDQALNGKSEASVDLKAQSFAKSLDLMFVVDTTGSMGDELSYLQAEMEDIIKRVKQEQGNNPLRLSVNFYRDIGDEYVVRPFPFTTDINQSISDLKKQSSEGGGDFEEAVDEALKSAIHEHDWSDNAYAKLLFLVLDAPPHDEAADRIRQLTRDAAARGIRIIPITGSGIDQNTEFLMRTLSVATGGAYVPLTNHSGIGGDHLEPTGESAVYKLNDLIVKIIGDYMK